MLLPPVRQSHYPYLRYFVTRRWVFFEVDLHVTGHVVDRGTMSQVEWQGSVVLKDVF